MMFGNLSVNQIEERLCVKFSDEIKNFLNSTRQQSANNIKENEWHCFDMPFVMCCGSQEFAIKVLEMLEPYKSEVKGQIGISW